MENQHTEVIRDFLEQNLAFYLDLLEQMVAINSFTAHPMGVNHLSDITAAAFGGLGFTPEWVQASSFLYGKHLVLTRNGRSHNGTPPPQIALISHLDTVYTAAEERENDFRWRREGERIYGPGTYDIKGGTVMIYMLLAALQARAPDVYDSVDWLILLNAAEEALVPDFGALCRARLNARAQAALVFEGGENGGNPHSYKMVVARKGMARYRIEVAGKAAHAGTSHALGSNAIVQMSDVIRRVADFTDYSRDLTFNVGTVAGGTVINRVPHQASASVEMRAFDSDAFAHGKQQMLDLGAFSSVRSVEDGYACRVQVEVLGEWQPWAPNAASERLLARWKAAAHALGLDVMAQARGGLSDGNWTWDQVPTLDGLGPDGGNAHCSERSADGSKDQEYVLPASFVPKTLLNVTAVTTLINDYYANIT